MDENAIGPQAVQSIIESFSSVLRFYVNGSRIVLDASTIHPDATLLDFLRSQKRLTGTKLGCGEGGCGACTVVLQFKRNGKMQHIAVNACLAPLVSVDGKHVITVEGVGNADNPHPLQQRLAALHGSQCGFCTPGIVMSIYALLRNALYDEIYSLTAAQIELEGVLDGNLCRCTGYKPILDAAKSFVGDFLKDRKDFAMDANTEHLKPRAGNFLKDRKGATDEKFDHMPPRRASVSSHLSSLSVVSTADEDSMLPSFRSTPRTTSTRDSSLSGSNIVPTSSVVTGCGRADCCQFKKDDDNGSSSEDQVLPMPLPTYELHPYRPGTELIYPPGLAKYKLQHLAFGNEKKIWIRPTTVEQLLAVKSAYPTAKIVGGSSEVQIEVQFKNMQYDVRIYVGDIEELSQPCSEPTSDTPYLRFGSNLSLTELEKSCTESFNRLGRHTNVSILEAIQHQLRYFAGRQIRNVASAAGNIVTASPISDLNPVLLAADARLIICTQSKDGQREFQTLKMCDNFFKRYRVTAMPSDGILLAVDVPIPGLVNQSGNDVVRSYKQAKRKDDDISIVTAGMFIHVDDDLEITEVRLAYGGMAPFPLLLQKTPAFLQGKKLCDKVTLQDTLTVLREELDLPFNVPGGAPTYRVTLALSFFYRFYHDVIHTLCEDVEHDFEVSSDITSEIHRGLSTGKRDNSDPYAQEVVGRQLQHRSGLLQTTGEAIYIDDMPHIENEGYGALVTSERAHAKIISVDVSVALTMPGVIGWVDHRDVHSPTANKWGIPHDEEFFASDYVVSHGQPIGLIVADEKANAKQAARAVKVVYDDLPAILTIEESIEANSFYDYHQVIKRGLPIEEAFKESDHVLEGVTRMGGQEHFYLETQCSLIIPKLESGEMEVWSSTQNLQETQMYIAKATGVDRNRIVAKTKRIGGGFGGKETRTVLLAVILAVAAKKFRRAIRCMLDRDQDMMISGQRHPFLVKWKIGCDRNGKLTALKLDGYSNGGYSADLSLAVADRFMGHIDNAYYCPNVDASARVCRTNTVSNTAFRGFGSPQGMFTAESYINMIAEKLQLNVDDVRSLNFYKEGETTHYLQKVVDWHVPRLMKEVREESNFDGRRKEVDEWNQNHKWRKRGIALLPTSFGIGYGWKPLNQGSALVHIYTDGSVLVHHGGIEMGQGLYTKVLQVAAQELMVPIESVFTSESSTATVVNTSPTSASSGADLNGMAVKNACEKLNERLAPFRKKLGEGAKMNEIASAAYEERVLLSATGHYVVPKIDYVWGNFVDPKPMFAYYTQGAAVAEVEVDCLTGDHTVLRVDIKMDVGRSINPAIDYGQVEGGFVQGYGLFTMEESLWLRGGQLFTKGPGTYKIPGFSDIPQEFNVSFLKDAEWPNLFNVQSSKGVGEPPLFLGATVFFALRDAVQSAQKQFNPGTPLLEFRSPFTSERIRLACGDPLVVQGTVEPKPGETSFFVHI